MAEKQEALGLVEYRGKGGEFKTLPKFFRRGIKAAKKKFKKFFLIL